MKKTYWWRFVILIISGMIILLGLVYDKYICFSDSNECPFDNIRLIIIEPIVISSIFILIVSFLLFFISDKIFIKWLKFAAFWMGITALFVLLAPAYIGGWMSFGPTKESVSIWMGSLFVILSLIKITWDWKNERNGRN
ncbi:MAG: Uncharacterized protein Athens071425_302 [Parcubacteria group bacterium Athens0714_25]|nr:MAG: Uncharacterized protein Athens071425_302 [Parcubacteria group bacterium Athens0714_25]